MNTRVRAALFDLGGVILHFRGNGRAEAEKKVGLPPGTLRRLAYKEAFALANYGVYTHQEWLEAVRRDLVAAFGPRAGAAVEVWAKDPGELDEEAVTVLKAVRAQGIQVGILTNNTSGLVEDLARLGFDAFDTLINSADIGVIKPSPVSYRLAVEAMGVPAEEIFFTDDNHTNVIAARHVGLCAVDFVSVPRLVEDFAACGVTLPLSMPDTEGEPRA
ncbi:HAD family phosphatase [Nocardiopsis dassonvillei]|uniref:HAD family hydrolase n=1 Tax=Nocardiopsis dassonvillei TaxID=2014 RepID=UPI002010743C|nr:HAD family phosphatase [Nocardiopsis dassonvillei]MCK9870295.1 HAD family phosphatase [Nocardiopsis dassonvillei]